MPEGMAFGRPAAKCRTFGLICLLLLGAACSDDEGGSAGPVGSGGSGATGGGGAAGSGGTSGGGSGGSAGTPGGAAGMPSNAVHDLRVVLIGLDPVENGERLSEKFYPKPGMSAEQVEDQIADIASTAFQRATAGRVRFSVVKKVHVSSFPPYTNGYQYDFAKFAGCAASPPAADCETQKWLADYDAWIADNDICQLAKDNDADELWVVSSPFLLTWENFMIGPTPGFNVNGGTYVTSACDRHYVVMNPTYERLDTVMHNYGHRLEQTMGYLSERWSAADRKQHWQDFSAIARYQNPSAPYNQVSCGNAHFAPNSQSAYDYGNQTQVSTSCPDWGNFPNYSGATTQVSCTDWGCNDNGWNEYWMAAVPKSDGDAQLSDVNAKPFQFPRDWWSLALYPDKAIAFREMLEAL